MTKQIQVSFLFWEQLFRLNLIEQAYEQCTLITESEESQVCPIVVRRSYLIRFRQEKERSPSALDKGTVRKIDNKIKILGLA